MTVPKRHHYIPEFNLALFTPSGRREDTLSVLLVPSGERLRLRAGAIGFEKHFYRVPEVPDLDPAFFETALSNLESCAAPAIRRLVQTERMPTNRSEDRATIINYLALQAARGPATRRRLAEIANVFDHLRLRAAAASPELVRQRMSELREREGGVPPDEADVQGFVQMVRDRKFTIERHPAEHVLSVIRMHDSILQTFALRWWSVIVRRTPPYFITSDNPVVLAWGARPSSCSPPPEQVGTPGFALPFTEVTFPVSRHVALVGAFEPPPARHVDATRELVASVNSRTIGAASRFLASPTDDIVWLNRDRQLAGADAIPAFLGELAAQRERERSAELAQTDRFIPLP